MTINFGVVTYIQIDIILVLSCQFHLAIQYSSSVNTSLPSCRPSNRNRTIFSGIVSAQNSRVDVCLFQSHQD